MPHTVFVVHGSHPCATVLRALELKGIAHRVVEWPPPLHVAAQQALFGRRTVPALRLADGERIVGSRAILRRLEELAPEPPLYPPGEEARARADRAEEWGDEVWQPIARRLLWGALRRRPAALAGYGRGSRLGLPPVVVRALTPVIIRGETALNDAHDGPVRADLRTLPRHLDRIDRWIADGTLGAALPTAADLQIAPTTRLMLTLGDVAALIAGRPAEGHARRLFPKWAGEAPPGTYPSEWLRGN